MDFVDFWLAKPEAMEHIVRAVTAWWLTRGDRILGVDIRKASSAAGLPAPIVRFQDVRESCYNSGQGALTLNTELLRPSFKEAMATVSEELLHFEQDVLCMLHALGQVKLRRIDSQQSLWKIVRRYQLNTSLRQKLPAELWRLRLKMLSRVLTADVSKQVLSADRIERAELLEASMRMQSEVERPRSYIIEIDELLAQEQLNVIGLMKLRMLGSRLHLANPGETRELNDVDSLPEGKLRKALQVAAGRLWPAADKACRDQYFEVEAKRFVEMVWQATKRRF